MTSRELLMEKLGLTEDDFKPKSEDRIEKMEAQALFTAIMTDTVIEEDIDLE